MCYWTVYHNAIELWIDVCDKDSSSLIAFDPLNLLLLLIGEIFSWWDVNFSFSLIASNILVLVLTDDEKNRLDVSLSCWLNKSGRLTISILCIIDVWYSTDEVAVVFVVSHLLSLDVDKYILRIADGVNTSDDGVEDGSFCDRTFFGDDGLETSFWFIGVDVSENDSERMAYSLLQIDLRCAGVTDDNTGGRYY